MVLKVRCPCRGGLMAGQEYQESFWSTRTFWATGVSGSEWWLLAT